MLQLEKREISVMMSEKLKNALRSVSGEVSWDLGPRDRRDARIVAEVTIDADRLEMFGHPEANKEVTRLCEHYGYPAVLAEAAKYVSVG